MSAQGIEEKSWIKLAGLAHSVAPLTAKQGKHDTTAAKSRRVKASRKKLAAANLAQAVKQWTLKSVSFRHDTRQLTTAPKVGGKIEVSK